MVEEIINFQERPVSNSTITVSAFAKMIDDTISGANATLAKGAASLVERPEHTLEWAGSLFTAAAQLNVYTGIQNSLNLLKEGLASGEKTEADAQEYIGRVATEVVKRTLQRAKSPKQSTAAAANLLDQEITKVYADLAEQMAVPSLYGLTREYA